MAEVLITCPCNHCSGFLEFETQHVGSTVTCPHCQLETTLFHHSGDELCPAGDTNCPPESIESTPAKPLDPGVGDRGASRDAIPPCLPTPGSILRRDPYARMCSVCGSVVHPYTYTPGSFAIELLLWLSFILPGLIYSIWRLTARRNVCPRCQSHDLLPLDSPRAQHLASQLGVDTDVFYGRDTSDTGVWPWIKAFLITVAIIAFLVSCQAVDNHPPR